VCLWWYLLLIQSTDGKQESALLADGGWASAEFLFAETEIFNSGMSRDFRRTSA